MINPKVTIVIPVYNAEKYIEKCINSILNQSLKEIEIIVINDGSRDNSLCILQEIAKNNDNLRVLTQENKGASAARNLGIKKANGEYIGFVDIDDYIENDMYFKMYNKAIEKNYDIVSCSFMEETETTKTNFTEALFGNKELIGEEIKNLYLDKIIEDKFLGYLPLWNKIFKRKFISKYNIWINENMILGEDRVFCSEAIFKADKIANVNDILYHYMKINSDSLTNRYDIKKVGYYLEDRRSMLKFVKDNVIDKEKLYEYKKIYNKRVFYKLLDYMLNQIKTNDKLLVKYRNIKYILSLEDMRETYNIKIQASFFTKILIYLAKYKCYILVYAIIWIRYNYFK